MTIALALLATLACPFGLVQDSQPVSPEASQQVAGSGPREVEIEFEGAGGLGLHGTLVLPLECPAGGAPAMLLLPGSGPTDRNGNQKPYLTTDLLKSIAAALAEEGIASVRFDKRASKRYHLQLMMMTVEQQDEFFAWDCFVDDALRALTFLRGHEEVDSDRCGILGHSEGGLIALEAARRSAPVRPPAALVLASTAGTTMTELLRYQLGRIFEPYGEDVREKLMAEFERVAAHIVETGTVPDDVPPSLGAFFQKNVADLLSHELALDPAELARKVRGPVLILHGEHDIQVPPKDHVERLAGGLREREKGSVDVVLVPGASHNLKPVGAPEEPGFEGEVVPLALSELRAWLGNELVGR
jgi:hypothetical protein